MGFRGSLNPIDFANGRALLQAFTLHFPGDSDLADLETSAADPTGATAATSTFSSGFDAGGAESRNGVSADDAHGNTATAALSARADATGASCVLTMSPSSVPPTALLPYTWVRDNGDDTLDLVWVDLAGTEHIVATGASS